MTNNKGYSVELKNVYFNPSAEGKKGVLNNVSFKIDGGKFVSIIGRNGHGKTSIMRAIAGEIDSLKGEVFVSGKLVDKPINSVISGVGIVHQFVQYDLIKELSIAKNIQIRQLLGNEKFNKIDISDRNWVANTNAELAKVIDDKETAPTLDYLVESLSGGQRQLLNVYIALKAEHPENICCSLLLLDEHLTSLDYVIQKKVMTLINTQCPTSNGTRPTTIIMVTHNFEYALKYSDKILVVKNGTIKEIIYKTNLANWTIAYLEDSIEK
jgi:ABC-type uncharacterized transport system ATPase component